MYEWNGEGVIVFAPAGWEEAARVFKRCSELAAEGRAVRAGIIESPYRPGARFGFGCGDTRIAGPEIPVHVSAAEVMGSIESADRGAAFVLLTHRRMDRIREISKTDMLAVVDGGVSWNELRSAVSGTGLYLPCEIGAAVDGSTVAEIVMGGAGASTDGRFGGLREHVLSIEMVTAGGELVHTGSRSVKDVGGYDVAGFVIGEGGRCGMVTRVTMRLVPEPGSRIVFEARGGYTGLRGLARHVHRRMRPAFLEIYEGRAAALIDGVVETQREGWGGGSRREATTEGTSDEGGDRALLVGELQAPGRGMAADRAGHRALLVGELHAPGPGREERLLEEAVAGFEDGPPLVMCAPKLVQNRRRILDLAFSALDRGRGIVHCSFETGIEAPCAPGSIRYRSLYPERLHVFTARDEIDPHDAAGYGDPSIRQRTLLDVLASFGAESDTGMRSEVTLLYRCNGSLGSRRIHRDEFDRSLTESLLGGDTERSRGHSDAYDVLWRRVREVFDPRGIMLP